LGIYTRQIEQPADPPTIILFDNGSILHRSPHKRYTQILANLARQFVYDLAVSRHLRLTVVPLKNAMPSTFPNQHRAMGFEMLE